MKKKGLVIAASVMLVLCLAVGGTLAWLSDKTGEVKNTFTYGDINIDLTETTGTEYKMLPGATIAKDPKVTVEAGSEACWLFVEVKKSSNFDTYLTYDVADGWVKCSEADGVIVYGRIVDKTTATAGTSYNVIKDNKVTVNNTVTKAMMNAIDGIIVDADGEVTATDDATELAARPTLTFKAYAVQLEAAGEADTAEEAPAAWTAVKGFVA